MAAAVLGDRARRRRSLTSASGRGAATAGSAPGVTPNSITVGSISTQTGTLAANFASLIYGEKAYFDYVNAAGRRQRPQDQLPVPAGRRRQPDHLQPAGQHADQPGPRVRRDRCGHRLLLAQRLRRGQDPHLRLQRDRATGPARTEPLRRRWLGPVLPGRGPQVAFVAKKTQNKPTIAMVAYGVAASAAPCQAEQNSAEGGRVQHRLHRLQGRLPGLDRGHRRAAHEAGRANLVLSCMDVQGNVTMARAIKQYGLKTTQLWFSGNDESTLAPEPEPDAGHLLRHRARALHGARPSSTRVSSCT